jgi:hypothetical protein
MIWSLAVLLFFGCATLSYFRFFLGAIIAFACPPFVGLAAWLFTRDPLMDFIDKQFMIFVFVMVVLIIELGLFAGGLLRVI